MRGLCAISKTVLLILNHFFGSFLNICYQRSAHDFQFESNPQIAQMTQTMTPD